MLEFLFLFALLALVCLFVFIPVLIANARNLSSGEKTAIIILSWFGIFFGVTWVVALVLSLVWRGEKMSDGEYLDKLAKLSALYKDKAITKAEYESMKAKFLK